MPITSRLRQIADSSWFQQTVTIVIILAGVLVGLETYPHLVAAYGDWMHLADKIILGIFVAEIVVKMGAEGKTPWKYFRDPWNVFDFTIVTLSFLPIAGQAIVVLRLIRLLRVLRLVRALPKLQLLVGALLKSLPSMGYVGLLLFILFYVYAVAGTFLFGHHDPGHFGTLQRSFLTLFETVTLEGWVDVLNVQMEVRPVAAVLFFLSFILLGTMIMLNLFIGVIMNGMQEAQSEALTAKREVLQAIGGTETTIREELARLRARLREVDEHITQIEAHPHAEPMRRSG